MKQSSTLALLHSASCHNRRRTAMTLDRSVFASRYQLIRRLGAGVSASVYLARDVVLDREIALKAVPMGDDPQTAVREAETLALLSHPNIVTIYEAFAVEEYFVVTMEYLEGGTLAARLHLHPEPFELPTFSRYARDLLLAFTALHEKNIVHRDCKPSNIGFTRDGVLKLLDFGISKHLYLNGITIDGTIKATAEYAPPEQLLGDQVDARCDLFSVAVVLYEMLTGVHPFLAGVSDLTPPVMLARLLFKPPVPLRLRRPDLPEEIGSIIMQNLDKERDNRSRSAQHFLDAMERRSGPPRQSGFCFGSILSRLFGGDYREPSALSDRN